MILIADSGSTKTHWRLIDAKKTIHSYDTQGINPYFQNQEEITSILKNELIPHIKSDLADLKIFFYGAGCSASAKNTLLKNTLNNTFPYASIQVNEDMLAAAKALCGDNKGIVAILGTGSNTCYYDGKKIGEQLSCSGLGYILGDEGSGAHLGLTLIKAYLYEEMPKHLSNSFYERYKLNANDIKNAIYKEPMPSRFLASFSTFIHDNINDTFIVDIVTNCFEQFFDKQICKYKMYKDVTFNCVGSIAFYYSNILTSIANSKGIKMGKIIQSPITDLTNYHLQHQG